MNIDRIRSDFPALDNNDIIYFDNTSATLTPTPVINAISEAYRSPGNARSGHRYSVDIVLKIGNTRKKIVNLIGADNIHEIIFTKNATESINLVSNVFPFEEGDVVLTTDKEHNSNMNPWQLLGKKGVKHKVVPSFDDHVFDLEKFKEMMNNRVKLVSMAYTSIIDGYNIPAKEVCDIAHEHGAKVLLDGVLTVPYQPVNVTELDADFLAFSMHNMCGPAGVGVLYGKIELLKELPLFMAGGGTAVETTYEGSEFYQPPAKFEAGANNYPGIIGAGAAVDYITQIGLDNIQEHTSELSKYICGKLKNLDILTVQCAAGESYCGRMCSFNLEGFNPHDLAIHLEEEAGILVRSGIHCAHSWYKARGGRGGVSVTFYIYNTKAEIDRLGEELGKVLDAV